MFSYFKKPAAAVAGIAAAMGGGSLDGEAFREPEPEAGGGGAGGAPPVDDEWTTDEDEFDFDLA